MWKRSGNRRAREAAATPRRRLGRRVLAAAAIATLLAAAFWALNRPIRAVTVTGRFRHVAPLAIEQVVAREARGSGLLTVSLTRVRDAVAAVPWVAQASVQRAWPDGLQVRVREQVAVARWNGAGLVNRDGVLFVLQATGVPHGLARLSGPQGTEAQVTRRYLDMESRLAPSGLAITALEFDARGTWQLALSDGITVRLGRSQVDERFDKFMNAALAIVRRRSGAISYIDMRYTNGFAIGWKAGAPQSAAPARQVVPGGRDA